MIFYLVFKNIEEEDKENCPLTEDLQERLNSFHEKLMEYVSLQALLNPPEEEVSNCPYTTNIYLIIILF